MCQQNISTRATGVTQLNHKSLGSYTKPFIKYTKRKGLTTKTEEFISRLILSKILLYYLIRRILLFYQVLDNFDYFVGISLIELSTGQ